jgi:sterol desaturase/sphingolipid hydroxylase (fatty acid hydroxylase superfamily)
MRSALTFAAFWGLVAFTASALERRKQLGAKSARDWTLDIVGLLVQGLLIPIVGVAALLVVYGRALPDLAGAIHLPWPLAFGLSFVLVDYAYYWNHRLLHTRVLWRAHMVHHTAQQMDVFVTSRNTLWTSALIVYLWASSFASFVLEDPSGYLAGAALTSILDLARHAPISLSRWPLVEKVLGAVFVLPRDHALHHADLEVHGNYGANFNLWDRIHGTYLGPLEVPARLGIDSDLSLSESLFWPRER